MLAREEFRHHRLDIERGRRIDCIQFTDKDSFCSEDSTDGAPDTVGTVRRPLREDADQRPLVVIPEVTSAGGDFRRIYRVK